MKKLQQLTALLLLTAFSPMLWAGDGPLDWGDPSESRTFRNVYVGGMYRLLGYHTMLSKGYAQHPVGVRRIAIGDGYRIPALDLTIGAQPFPRSWFSSQIYFTPSYTGPQYETTQNVSLGLGVTMSTGIKTPIGYVNADLGGLNWKRLSPLTLWSNEGFNRFSIFDRSPWEQTGNAHARYNEFFQRGGIAQDTRWGRRAFQGCYLSISDMPGAFSTVLAYGKTDNNGGTDSYQLSEAPNESILARVQRGKDDYMAINTFNTVGYADTVNAQTYGINLVTGEVKRKLGEVLVWGEFGVGSYHSPSYDRQWSEGIVLKAQRKISSISLMAQVYRLGVNFVNPNGVFFNTSIAEAQQTGLNFSNSTSINPFHSPLTSVGQLTNNRTGIDLNAEYKQDRFAASLGYANSKEIERISTGLSFNHRVNGLQFSRWALFSRDLGPYRRVHSYWMGYYEEVDITDTLNQQVNHDKHFTTLELHLKYQFEIAGKAGYLFYLANLQSAHPKFSLLGNAGSASFLAVQNHELDLYFSLTKRLTLATYVGLERAVGGTQTGLNTFNRNPENLPSLKPIDQTGKAIGLGLDIDIAENAGLHIRHRWLQFSDANFIDDQYAGQETTIELKFTF